MSKDFSPELSFSNSLLSSESGVKYAVKEGVLYQWNGIYWEAQSAVKIERLALAWLAEQVPEKCSSRVAASCSSTFAGMAPALPHVPTSQAVVAVGNGYLHVNEDAADLQECDASLGVTYSLGCDYDPAAKAPKFQSFLEESLPDGEVRAFLQEYAGYTLMPDCRHQMAVWLIGSGGNGKSTFAQILQALHKSPVSMQLDNLEGFNLASLVGASLVYCDETPTRIDEQRLKTLISGDSVQIDRKYREPLVIRPTAKWIVSGNSLPAISDHSDGFWRRWTVIPFDIKPKVMQPLLGDIITRDELPGVLNWVLEGLGRVLKRRSLAPMPEALKEAQRMGRKQSNSVSGWVDDAGVSLSDSEFVSKKMAYHYYTIWCKTNGSKSVSSQKFWERMSVLFAGKMPEKRLREAGEHTRVVGLVFDNPDANVGVYQSTQSNSADINSYEKESRGS